MEIPAQRQHQLQTLFAALPIRSLEQLQAAFEHGRDTGDTQLPYDVLLAMLPFQDTQVDLVEVFHPASLLLGETDARPDRISISMLETMWQQFSLEDACQAVMSEADCNPDPAQIRQKLAYWLHEEWEAEGGGFRFKELLGRRNGAKVPMITSLLFYGEEISNLMADWPEEIIDPGDEILIPLRELHELLIDVDCNITPWLMFLLYARLRRPQEILRAVVMLTRQTSDMMLLMTNLKILPNMMIGEANELLTHLSAPFAGMDEVDLLEFRLQRFSGILFGSGEEFDIRPKGQWGKALSRLAGKSQQIWKRKLDHGMSMLQQVTPRSRLKSFLGGEITAAKMSGHLDAAQVDKVEAALNEIRIVFSYAPRLGIASLRDKYSRKFDMRLNEQVDNLIDLMADPGDIDYNILQDHFTALVRLTRAYRGPEEADVLQRRGAAIAA